MNSLHDCNFSHGLGVSGVQNRFGSVFFAPLFFSFLGLQARHVFRLSSRFRSPRRISFFHEDTLTPPTITIAFNQGMVFPHDGNIDGHPQKNRRKSLKWCFAVLSIWWSLYRHTHRCQCNIPVDSILWYLDRNRLDRERAPKLYHAPWSKESKDVTRRSQRLLFKFLLCIFLFPMWVLWLVQYAQPFGRYAMVYAS